MREMPSGTVCMYTIQAQKAYIVIGLLPTAMRWVVDWLRTGRRTAAVRAPTDPKRSVQPLFADE